MNIVTRIYGLVNPVSGEIFYIGRTCGTLRRRLRKHRRDAKTKNTPKARYIRNILWMGLEPGIVELHSVINASVADVIALEQAYIDFYKLTRNLANSATAYQGSSHEYKGTSHVVWSDELIAKLGKVPDRVIAEELGCSGTPVRTERIKRGIASCGNVIELPEELIKELGKVSDQTLAKKAGLSLGYIAAKRRELGIPCFSSNKKDYSEYRKSLHRAKFSQELIDSLGKEKDVTLAERFNLPYGIVNRIRRNLGIPTFKDPNRGASHKKTIPVWAIEKLGTMSDRDLASQLDVSKGCVARHRRELVIPPYKPKNAC